MEQLPINLGDPKELWDNILNGIKSDKTIKVLAVCFREKVRCGEKNRMFLYYSKRDDNIALIRKQVLKFSHVKELKRERRLGRYGDMLFFLAGKTDNRM